MSFIFVLGLLVSNALGGVFAVPQEVLALNDRLRVQKISSIDNRDCYRTLSASNSSEGSTFCYPSVIVAGFPKCGTSYLFQTLAAHPALRATRRKELCLGGVKSENWDSFVAYLAVDERSTIWPLMLSGCLHMGANAEAAGALATERTKYVYSVRHIADMLWAAYNYWCIQDIDSHCQPGQRTGEGSLRSPEHFHERIVAGLPMGGGIGFLTGGACFRPLIEKAIRAFGKDNVIVVKSESFLPSAGEIIRRNNMQMLLAALGLEPSTSFEDAYAKSHTLTNSGHELQSRGEFMNIQQPPVALGNTYEVSRFVPMLSATRSLLNKIWERERQWLQDTYEIQYNSA